MNKRQKRGCLLALLGLCMVLAAMGLHLAQEQQDALAGENAQVLLEYLDLDSNVPPAVTLPPETEATVATEPAEETVSQEPQMPIKSYMGYEMIGAIEIPSVDIHLPVLRDWDYDLLEVAPCRYSGSADGGDLILMGHNYHSHFTPLHSVTTGADVVFTDVNGQTYAYRVAEITYLHKSEEEKLDSGYPLTLFTCTDGGQRRILIRCEAAEESK